MGPAAVVDYVSNPGRRSNMPSPTESELEFQYAAGDKSALAALWLLHIDSFKALATVVSGHNPEIAENAIGKLGVKLADKQKSQTYEPSRGRWSPWAKQILRNIIKDELRRLALIKAATRTSRSQDDDVYDIEVVDTKVTSPIDNSVYRELKEWCARALSELNDRERTAVILRVYYYWTYREIGALLQQGVEPRTDDAAYGHKVFEEALQRLRETPAGRAGKQHL